MSVSLLFPAYDVVLDCLHLSPCVGRAFPKRLDAVVLSQSPLGQSPVDSSRCFCASSVPTRILQRTCTIITQKGPYRRCGNVGHNAKFTRAFIEQQAFTIQARKNYNASQVDTTFDHMQRHLI